MQAQASTTIRLGCIVKGSVTATATVQRILWRSFCGCVLAELTDVGAVVIKPCTDRAWRIPRPLPCEIECTCRHGNRHVLTEAHAEALSPRRGKVA